MTADEVMVALTDGTLSKITAGDIANTRPSLVAFVQAIVDDQSIPRARVRDTVLARLRAAYGLPP